MKRTLFFLLLAGNLIVTGLAQAATTTHEQLVARVMALDGADSIFDSIPAMFSALASQRLLVSKQPEQDRQVFDTILQGIELEAAKKEFAEYIAQHADDNTLTAVQTWLVASPGNRISEAEIEASKMTDQSDLIRYLSSLQAQPPTKERSDLVRRFVELNNMGEVYAKIINNIVTAMMKGAAEADDDVRDSMEELDTFLEQANKQLVESMRQQSILSSYYIYRSISDQEMQQYISFMATEPYRKFSAAITGGIDTTLSTMFRQVGKKLAEQARAQRLQPEESCTPQTEPVGAGVAPR